MRTHTHTLLCHVEVCVCILCVIYSHSRNVFPGEGIGGVADEETCFTHSSERNKQTQQKERIMNRK